MYKVPIDVLFDEHIQSKQISVGKQFAMVCLCVLVPKPHIPFESILIFVEKIRKDLRDVDSTSNISQIMHEYSHRHPHGNWVIFGIRLKLFCFGISQTKNERAIVIETPNKEWHFYNKRIARISGVWFMCSWICKNFDNIQSVFTT